MIKNLKSSIVNFVSIVVTRLYLSLFLYPISRKHTKNHIKLSKLESLLTISEVDKKGGAAKIAYHIHKTLLNQNVDSNILAGMVTSSEEKIFKIEQRYGVIQKLLSKYEALSGWRDFFHLSSFDILKLNQFKNSSLLHLHNLHVNYFSKFALPLITSKKRTVWTLHDNLDLYEDFPDLNSKEGEIKTHSYLTQNQREHLRKQSRRIVENSYLKVVAPSEWLRQKAMRGIFKDKDVRLIYNGVDENIFKPYDKSEIRKELGLPVGKKILLFSAAWGLAEGTKDSRATLLAMYKELSSNQDILFAILGGGGEDFKESNSVSIPYVSDQVLLAKYYSSADLFIYPSLWDNCPLTVIENMAVGTPVITYNTGGIPELVTHMETGYIAKYNDSQDFIKGVKLFLDDTELRNSAANQSTKVFKERFTLDTMVKKYISLYTEMLKQ